MSPKKAEESRFAKFSFYITEKPHNLAKEPWKSGKVWETKKTARTFQKKKGRSVWTLFFWSLFFFWKFVRGLALAKPVAMYKLCRSDL